METSKTFLAISCVMVVFVVGVVYSQQQGMRPRVFTKENHVMPKNAEEQNITRPLRIVVETLEGGDRQQQTVLETALRSQTKVESREKLLEPVLKHPDLRLAGWHQRICEVKQVAGVTTVTVCVQPIMESSGGTFASVDAPVEEIYELNGTSLKLVSSKRVGNWTDFSIIIG